MQNRLRLAIRYIIKVLSYFIASLLIIIISLIRPVILIRFGVLISSRLGHFAGNTELYLCEKYSGISTKRRLCFDFFYCEDRICNKQLFSMWKKNIVILPKNFWSLFFRLDRLIRLSLNFSPLLKAHVVKSSKSDRDIHGLINKTPINLKFTKNEIKKGCLGLVELGIPEDAKIVLLYVRDSAYLESIDNRKDWSYHNHRDCNIDNYILVSEKLAEMGYYVLRMGVTVNKALETKSPMVIDYANHAKNTEFMDIYLASICEFVISCGVGGDAPAILCFRKPCVFVNVCPIFCLWTFNSNSLAITKHHVSATNNNELTLKEIFSTDVGVSLNSECYKENGVVLLDNTPKEICDIAIEMVKKLSGSWESNDNDRILQTKFWDIFPYTKPINGEVQHGEIRMTYGSNFLRNNTWWLK